MNALLGWAREMLREFVESAETIALMLHRKCLEIGITITKYNAKFPEDVSK
jgi:hypothetical protein